MTRKQDSAFTLIEMLVVIAIIATIAAFAVPALTNAMSKGQLTGTMNNARQLYLAGYQMSLDGANNSDANLQWPGDYATAPTLQTYCQSLVTNGYLQGSDIPKILSAPGATCTATTGTDANGNQTVTLGGKSALKVYPVKSNDPSNVIFAVTANYTYDTAFAVPAPNPYGDKGFVVVRKGGDGSVLRKANATATAGQTAAFESTVGKKPGEAEGTVTPGDPQGVMKLP